MAPKKSATEAQRDRAVEQARQELALRSPDRFSSLLSYGAIEIAAEHLVVWVLFSGSRLTCPPAAFPAPTATASS